LAKDQLPAVAWQPVSVDQLRTGPVISFSPLALTVARRDIAGAGM